MAKIKLDPSVLLAQATEMENLGNEYASLFSSVTSVLNQTNENWSANLAHNFSGKITTAQKGFSGVVDMLDFGASAAKTSAETFSSIDSQLAKLLGNTTHIGSSGVEHTGKGRSFYSSDKNYETGESISFWDWITGRADSKTIVITSKKFGGNESYEKIKQHQKATEEKIRMQQIGEIYKYDWMSCGKSDVTIDFLEKVIEISDKLGVLPDDLMAVMAFESGLDHTAKNNLSGATGLIQFMPSTAIALGTSTESLANMSAVEQLEYVYKYLNQYNVNTLDDLYMAILWPAGIGKNDNYVLWQQGSIYYSQNSGLDVNCDGIITKSEAMQRVRATRKAYVGE